MFIYALVDPRTHVVRYVGCTVDPVARLGGHLTQGNCTGRFENPRRWVRALLRARRKPKMVILASRVPRSRAEAVEQYWIEVFKRISGRLLTNIQHRNARTGAVSCRCLKWRRTGKCAGRFDGPRKIGQRRVGGHIDQATGRRICFRVVGGRYVTPGRTA